VNRSLTSLIDALLLTGTLLRGSCGILFTVMKYTLLAKKMMLIQLWMEVLLADSQMKMFIFLLTCRCQ
jgi:hypothetical protein